MFLLLSKVEKVDQVCEVPFPAGCSETTQKFSKNGIFYNVQKRSQ